MQDFIKDLVLVLEDLDHDLGVDGSSVRLPKSIQLLHISQDHHLIPLVLAFLRIFLSQHQPLPHLQLEKLKDRFQTSCPSLIYLLLVIR
jgi:hypothetical protein